MFKQQPTIMISGYYGFGNAGDDAILAAMVQQMKANIPDVRIIVLTEAPHLTATEYDVETHNRKDLVGIFSKMKNIDLLVSGGGGLVQDSTGFATVAYYLGIVTMAKMRKKKVMLYAQGLGPLQLKKSRDLAKFVMNQVDLITYRDEESYALSKEIGVVKPPIYVTADPVFAIVPPSDETLEPIILSEKLDTKCLKFGISVRPWKTKIDYQKIIADVAYYFYKNYDAKIFLIPFQDTQDMEICRAIQRKMENPAHIIPRKYPIPIMLGLVGKMDLVLGMRLHSLIFSITQNVPCAGISYDPKVANLMEVMGLPYLHLDEVTEEKLKDITMSIYEKREEIRWNMTAKSRVFKERANKNIELMKKLLQENGDRG